jgi:hypothetical protein
LLVVAVVVVDTVVAVVLAVIDHQLLENRQVVVQVLNHR